MAVKVAAEEVAMRSDLSNVMVAMESYSASHGSYAPTLDALQMVASDGVTITLSGVSETGYTATASHVRLATTRCVLTVATGSAEATTCTH
jgi:Tfp pilus assembly protein PilE